MSAWYIMSAMGFYPVDPVSGNYIFGSPLFDQVKIQLGGDKQLELVAHRSKPTDKYIQSVTFNGKPYTRSWFNHRDIVDGALVVGVDGLGRDHQVEALGAAPIEHVEPQRRGTERCAQRGSWPHPIRVGAPTRTKAFNSLSNSTSNAKPYHIRARRAFCSEVRKTERQGSVCRKPRRGGSGGAAGMAQAASGLISTA